MIVAAPTVFSFDGLLKGILPVGRLPTNGSSGQLFVKVVSSFGRFVLAPHEVQKKAESFRRRSGSLTAPAGMAYSALPLANTSE